MTLASIFKYGFMQRALLVGGLISLSSAMLGVTLVLKRYAMMGDGLSHVAFGSLSIALALGLSPLVVALPVVTLAAFLLLHLNRQGKTPGDAALGMISSGALALGVLVTSLTSGLNADINNYMFGTVLAISDGYVWASIILTVLVVGMFVFFYGWIFSVTFDEEFSQASGLPVSGINMLVGLLTAVTIVIGMKIMGALLISSLIIFPVITAMRLRSSFRGVILWSALLALLGFVVGLVLSYLTQAPTGAMVVMVHSLIYILGRLVGRMSRAKREKALRRG